MRRFQRLLAFPCAGGSEGFGEAFLVDVKGADVDGRNRFPGARPLM